MHRPLYRGVDLSRTRYARSGKLRIAYELRGSKYRRRPWLVLIQGMGFDRFGWGPVLPKLQRHFRLVLVDNRASGLSDRSAGVFAVADMARDIVAVLDAAGVRKAHVMGASLGGMVAQELAVSHPERVDGLVLACTTPGWPFAYPMPSASVRLIAATAGTRAAEATRRRHIENALSARTVQHHPELVDRLIELRGSHPVDPGALSAQAAAGALYVGRLRQTRIRARTLVLQGGADTVVDPRNGRLLAGRIPGARLVTFPELGHLLFWEDPDGFADAVTSFLLADPGARKKPPAAVSGPARGTGPGRERPLAGLVGKALTAHRRTRQRVGRNAVSRHDGAALARILDRSGTLARQHTRPRSFARRPGAGSQIMT
jgi:pimeloyl-ACP methyl ester carboxylesterase